MTTPPIAIAIVYIQMHIGEIIIYTILPYGRLFRILMKTVIMSDCFANEATHVGISFSNKVLKSYTRISIVLTFMKGYGICIVKKHPQHLSLTITETHILTHCFPTFIQQNVEHINIK